MDSCRWKWNYICMIFEIAPKSWSGMIWMCWCWNSLYRRVVVLGNLGMTCTAKLKGLLLTMFSPTSSSAGGKQPRNTRTCCLTFIVMIIWEVLQIELLRMEIQIFFLVTTKIQKLGMCRWDPTISLRTSFCKCWRWYNEFNSILLHFEILIEVLRSHDIGNPTCSTQISKQSERFAQWWYGVAYHLHGVPQYSPYEFDKWLHCVLQIFRSIDAGSVSGFPATVQEVQKTVNNHIGSRSYCCILC